MGADDGPSEKYDGVSPPPPGEVYKSHVHWNPKWEEVEKGLSTAEHEKRIADYGPNSLPEKTISQWWNYFQHYTGPMPMMIWLAIFLLAMKCLFFKPAYPDLVMCCLLQFVNANVKFYNAENAKHAINALKSKMAPRCFVKRDGNWLEAPAKDLVPGDVVQINIGMIIPADVRFGPCENIQSDQAALTGESLPSTKMRGAVGYASSVIKRGEGEGVVVGTGESTEMGTAAKLVASVKKTSRYDFILFYVALYLLVLAGVLMTFQAIWLAVVGGTGVVTILAQTVTILIGALPVAMHVVCMTIMAVGAYRLSAHGAVVSELTAVEELSGMTILCSDKTGTLTLNKLEIIRDKCIMYGDFTLEDLYWYSALACKRATDGLDAIDYCITSQMKSNYPNKAELFDKFHTEHFVPFDPVAKRTEAQIQGPKPEEDRFGVTKGAPQVILAMSHNFAELETRVSGEIKNLAHQGYRTLGVARSKGNSWEMIGLLAIADPPRRDTKQVIAAANSLGIKVVMITGDQLAIGKEVGKQVGIGENMMSAALLSDIDRLPMHIQERLPDIIERSDGFAEVFPEHKFKVVQELQKKDHIVGMTGDGVNDAPALKLANVGIAVSGATDAARAASSIFLQNEGLNVIISAIMRSKKVFERVKNYIIYRSATSLRLMGFFFVCTIAVKPLVYMPKVSYQGIGERGLNWRDDDNNNHCNDEKSVDDTIECIDTKGPDGVFQTTPTSSVGGVFQTTQKFWGSWHDVKIWQWANLCWEGLCEKEAIDDSLKSECAAGKKNKFTQPSHADAASVKNSYTKHHHYDWANSQQKTPKFWNCVEDLVNSDYYISTTFQTPTLVVVVLTLLNDFTVLTIAFDHVEISRKPDKWFLGRNIAIGTMIGANTLFWSVLMFIFMLNALDPTGMPYQTFGIQLMYPECLTGAFLQLSLCARLARTNARTENWFCTLSLHRSVVATMTFSIVAAMLLGFTWPLCPGRDCDPQMRPLNPKMVAIILLYQIPVHIVRDIFKQLLYGYFNSQDRKAVQGKEAEKKRIDDDCANIVKELDEGAVRGNNKEIASSVTLQAIDRERSGKFTGLAHQERVEAAANIVKSQSKTLASKEKAALAGLDEVKVDEVKVAVEEEFKDAVANGEGTNGEGVAENTNGIVTNGVTAESEVVL